MRFSAGLAFVSLARPTQRRSVVLSLHSSPNPMFRNATIADVPMLQKWDEKEHLCDPNVMGDADFNEWDWETELTKTPHWRHMLVAEAENGEPIGFVQIIDPLEEESHYWGLDCPPNLRAIDIWIGEEAYIGKGYGTAMMEKTLKDYCFSNSSVVAVLVDPMVSNPRAHRFYQKMGFQPVRTQSFGPDECLVLRLDRENWEKRNTA